MSEQPQDNADVVVVEVRRASLPNLQERRTVATLHVHRDGTWRVDGDASQVPADLKVVDPEGVRAIVLADDPASWARNLHRALRSGYVSAHTILDLG